MNEPPAPLTTAALAWADGQPLSTTFGDVYYSREDGLAESRHVFIEGNDLAARWEALAPDGRFTLMETGFGTGLNFLAAVSLWLERAPAGARLHYVSFEKFPLQRADLTRALAAWPTLSPLARELADAYPPPVPGFHRRWLYGDRVCLTLVFDDAIAGLDSLAGSDHPAFGDAANPRADAWFLDGFAPAKNPDLWSPALFAAVARLSGPGTTASTFTVARPVRDGLQGAGFALAKAPGFGRKRDMLRAIFAATAAPSAAPDAPRAPAGPGRRRGAFQPPWHLPPEPHRGPRHALVVGGGIAGCASANAL
ncbi:MAG TPA: tRNA (5-methylaminomethyl-2-thiouridine)(34)-methyltransferase MnmD, partial [Porticoccaceae bacterium]|nr:tRNA (5-methylaminomethyl-2-thiouridine)(34)-methyltransferase MnmD [Porticoccaceae bacterium]